MKVCVQCGTKIGKKDKFCSKCGSGDIIEVSGKVKTCQYCGETMDSKARFCPKCGQAFEGMSFNLIDDKKKDETEFELDFLKDNSMSEYEKAQAEHVRMQEELENKKAQLATLQEAIESLSKEYEEHAEQLEVLRVEEEERLRKEEEERLRREEEERLRKEEEERLRKEEEERLRKEEEERLRREEEERLRREEEERLRREEEERLRLEEEERLRKEEEERLRREEEERLRREEEERLRREEEERLRKEEEERLRKEEEERLRKEEEERLRKEEEERLRKEEEERLRREEEERLRREEEERLRREEEERLRREQEERERKARLDEMHKDAVETAKKAIAKYEKNDASGRTAVEAALDKMVCLYKEADEDMDLFDTEDLYLRIEEILGRLYYEEGAFKLAMPLIEDAATSRSLEVAVYYGEWLLKHRNEMPKEPDYLKLYVGDAVRRKGISDDERMRGYAVLAKVFHDGIGTQRNLSMAFAYYEDGAKLNDFKAMAKLGQSYLYGEGVNKDGKMALEWSRKAADHGNETGIRNVAVCYDFGTGTKRNATEAINWYRKLLEKIENDRFAMYRIAYCLTDPDREFGVKPTLGDYKEAFEFAKKALEGGEENANYIVGYHYMLGKAVAQDYNKAMSHFTKAANYGNNKAKEKLKLFVKNGSGNYVLK